MQQSFEYLKVVSALDSITVENVGNVLLKAVNDHELEWFLCITSDLGFTTVKEFGPWFRDSNIARKAFNYNIETKEYNEKYLCKRISNFLNDNKREITQVFEIDEEEFYDKLIDTKENIL